MKTTGLFTALFLATIIPFSAQAQKGERSFGPRVGYVTKNDGILAGLTFQYSFSNHFRLAPEIDVVFRNNDLDALTIYVNTHYPISFASGKAAFYPVAGINFSSWSRHNVNNPDSDDVTSHTNCFGVNAGAGIEYKCSNSLKINFEAVYTLIKHFPNAKVSVGINYVF